MLFIANIWAYSDLLTSYIATLGLDFPVYAGKPVVEPQWKYAYFRLESNHPKVADDSIGTIHKKADFDFVFVGGGQNTSDKEIYEMLDNFSQAFMTENSGIILGNNFQILSIFDTSQSGVLRDEKWNPVLLWGFSVIYRYKYSSNPR